VFGSFWSGIKLLQLNPATGTPLSPPKLFSLSETTAPDPEEGAYVVAHGGYYYLLVSSGVCCKGIGSSYEITVGRSAQITGPYVDPNGTPMTNGGGMELLGSDEGMIGPGSPSVYVSSRGDLIDYDYYDPWDNGDPWIQSATFCGRRLAGLLPGLRSCRCLEPLWLFRRLGRNTRHLQLPGMARR
jgi:arabinan endo-1,5-alpha-L-arabinosidase